jgi:hypothetical protein
MNARSASRTTTRPGIVHSKDPGRCKWHEHSIDFDDDAEDSRLGLRGFASLQPIAKKRKTQSSELKIASLDRPINRDAAEDRSRDGADDVEEFLDWI